MSESDKDVSGMSMLQEALETATEAKPTVAEDATIEPDVKESLTTEEKTDTTTPEVPVKEEIAEPQYTEDEKAAMAKGWKPKGSFDEGTEGKSFVSAKEFLDRQKFYDTISSQSKQIRNLESTLAEVHSHIKRTEEAAYKRALEDIARKKTEAVESGDVDMYKTLEAEQAQLAQTQQLAENKRVQETEQRKQQELIDAFKARNPWFDVTGQATGEDLAMTSYSVALSNKLHAQNPHISPEEEIRIVEEEVKKAFPHKYTNANQAAPAAVGTSTPAPKTNKVKRSLDDLPPEYRKVCKQFCSLIPGYTEEQYIEELISQGVIKND